MSSSRAVTILNFSEIPYLARTFNCLMQLTVLRPVRFLYLSNAEPVFMAWNHYYIFVKGPGIGDLDSTLKRLNLGAYKPIREVELHEANKPTTLFAGVYEGSLLLVHEELVFKFFESGQSEVERLFIQTFPEAEIAALIINESVGLFGFALIVNGKKVRMKDGCDRNYYNDLGEELPEEREAISGLVFMEEELEEMREDGMSEEEIQSMLQFEASYRVPNVLTERYLGKPVLQIDPGKVRITRYELG